MPEFSRRHMLSAATAGGVIAAAAGTETLAQGQPPLGPTPAPLAGNDLPSFRFQLGAVTPKSWDGGWAKEATVAEFPVSEKLAGVLMSLVPGGLRELHWHANAAEWAYVIKGRCRVTTIDPAGHSQIADFHAGDVWYFPRGFGHSIQGDRLRGLPVRARVRQRLFLRVRDFQHQRLDRAHAARGAGKEFRRAGADLRELSQTRGLHLQGTGAAAARRPIPRQEASTPERSRTATVCWRSSRKPIPAAPIAWCRSANFRSRRP